MKKQRRKKKENDDLSTHFSKENIIYVRSKYDFCAVITEMQSIYFGEGEELKDFCVFYCRELWINHPH